MTRWRFFLTGLALLTWQFSNAQHSLTYDDFHLEPSGTPQSIVMLRGHYLEFDTLSFGHYTFISNDTCGAAEENTCDYNAMNPISTFGLDASNIFVSYQTAAKRYFISTNDGLFNNGYDYVVVDPCHGCAQTRIIERDDYMRPQRIMSYPWNENSQFIDSAWYFYTENQIGCVADYPNFTSRDADIKQRIEGKGMCVGTLVTPCRTFDTVYFIRRTIYSDIKQQRLEHRTDTGGFVHDTIIQESIHVKTYSTIGVVKGGRHLLFEQQVRLGVQEPPLYSTFSDTLVLYYDQDPSLGMEVVAARTLRLYPNPVKDLLHINGIAGSKKIIVYNGMGMQVADYFINDQNPTQTLDVSMLAPGLYLLSLETREGKWVQHFVKQ